MTRETKIAIADPRERGARLVEFRLIWIHRTGFALCALVVLSVAWRVPA